MRKICLSVLSFLAAFVLLAGSGARALQGLKEEEKNFFVSTDPKYEELVNRVKRTALGDSFTGSVLIATDDEIILFGGPKAMTTEGLPVDPHTTYDIGSCSKLFTAVAVFQLIEEGRISLSDPVTRFFPEYETGRNITVYDLLHMRSEIADYVNEPEIFWTGVAPEDMDQFLARFYRDEMPDEEFLEYLYAAPLVPLVDGYHAYSNTNYHLLAMIVEQVTGMRFCDYLQEHVFDVCGLEHTTSMAIADETSVPKLFTEYRMAGLVNEDGYSMSPNQERGAGGIHCCTTDLWVFDRALLSGMLVGEESLSEMKHFDQDYGCGLMPYEKNAYGHSGRNGVYTTQNVIVESEKFGRVYIIICTSSDGGTYGMESILKVAMVQLGAF